MTKAAFQLGATLAVIVLLAATVMVLFSLPVLPAALIAVSVCWTSTILCKLWAYLSPQETCRNLRSAYSRWELAAYEAITK